MKEKLILMIIAGLLYISCKKEETTTGNSPVPVIPETVSDIDGNVYQTVKIGAHTWMAENLNVSRYRNGDSIPFITDSSQWISTTTDAYCFYNNDSTLAATYARLYNWKAMADARQIAPLGWHVPTIFDWEELFITCGGRIVAGAALKESGTSHWVSPNNGTNSKGFSALPAGQNDAGYLGNYLGFYGLGTIAR